jgi:alpha-L-rhamnosidase
MLPEGTDVEKAICIITADNSFALFVNGKKVGIGNNYNQAIEFDLTGNLHAGANVLAVTATNAGDTNNPAGVIGILRIEFAQGEPLVIMTDQQWRVCDKETAGWKDCGFDDSGWVAAQQLGGYGMAPWGDVGAPVDTRLAARMLRSEFQVAKKVERATVYVCGLGLFELYLNGQKVGDDVLAPGLTEYNKRAFYVTYDVTSQLNQGTNAVGVILGNGRYFAPRIKVPTNTRTFGYPKLILQMRIEYADGTAIDVVSDDSWKLTTNGPIRTNNEYDGEEYDAGMEQDGWCRPGFDDSGWEKAQLVKELEGVLVSQMLEPIRVTETIQPIAVINPKPGIYVYDMGQNMVGWVRLTVSGPKGTKILLKHSEVLRDDGMLYMDNLRGAKVTDVYVLKGEGVEIYEPRFTYHGFRYVEVKGYPGEPKLSAIEGQVVHDAVESAGSFSCSNPLINRIYSNILWGVRGNYRSIPTDCPQRDERQGWLGDRSAESKGESYLFNIAQFYGKWLTDIQDAQRENGSIPDVAPSYWPLYSDNVTWPGSYIIIPGMLFEQYADKRILEKHYSSQKLWIDFMSGYLKDYIMPRDQYGDWCVPPESQELIHSKDPKRKTAKEVIGTTYFYHELGLMARYATILGKTDDAKQFRELADKMKQTFNEKFFNKQTNQYSNGSQTSSVLPLAFGMVPKGHRQQVFDKLIEKIMIESNGHIGTGLIGGQWLMRVLSDNGRPDVAYTLATKKTYPSWGYMVEKGATTIWELWNGDTADPAMNSHNHVMLVGDLVIWFYEYLAGIKCSPDGLGFKKIIIKPEVVGDLTWVKGSYNSIHGRIVSNWHIENGSFHLNITVPTNTTATVYVPAKNAKSITESGRPAAKSERVRFLHIENNRVVFAVGSGQYQFVSKPPY